MIHLQNHLNRLKDNVDLFLFSFHRFGLNMGYFWFIRTRHYSTWSSVFPKCYNHEIGSLWTDYYQWYVVLDQLVPRPIQAPENCSTFYNILCFFLVRNKHWKISRPVRSLQLHWAILDSADHTARYLIARPGQACSPRCAQVTPALHSNNRVTGFSN